ncbi:hypothetical protein SEA_FORREST_264 [Streptomyces phage Forrest]|nr:hypothetical protein SEA_FORREST_264 [Streptomyces phage Forrest]QZE11597.1 hypothetical protein SEA_JADA_265 [Streptomyces phage Jada]
MGHIFAFMTGTAVSLDGGEDEREERHGWIDKEWSMTVLHESRNDVAPLVSVDESDTETLTDEIRDVLGDGSLWDDNGDGSFYSQGESVEDGYAWTYAVHFKRKGGASEGFAETDWHPKTDGGISLV